ncbi:MAG: hypothetical protein ACXV5Q_06360 [Frankiaceae bacterium]
MQRFLVGFLIIIPVCFVLSLIWVWWSVRPQRRPDANDSMQWHRRSMAALDPGRDPGRDVVAGVALGDRAVDNGVRTTAG